MFRLSIMIALAGASLAGPAQSAERCVSQLNGLVDDWRSIAVPGTQDSAKSRSQQGHEHTAREVEFMRRQIRLAQRLCNEGEEHEAMLRMDVVRAWLQLPEVRHPRDHRYKYVP
jgi:hypothetical protein